MIHDIDESLRELAKRDVLNGSKVDISFEAPTKEWVAKRSQPTINMYLYDIREDMERRQVQSEEIRDEHGIVTERLVPPRRFKLSYLITAWTQRPEDEHRLLSSLLSSFIKLDAIPDEVLQGDVKKQPFPIRLTVGLPLPADRAISDVWQALGGELKPSLDVIVTAPFRTGREFEVGPPVLEEPEIKFRQPATDEEETAGRKGSGKARKAAEIAPPDPDFIEETLHRGKGPAGRKVTVRTIPRKK